MRRPEHLLTRDGSFMLPAASQQWQICQIQALATEKKYRLPAGQKSPAARLCVKKFHQRLAKSELLKLHPKHYHMSSAQFRRRTSKLYLPEGGCRLYDGVVEDCEVCQKTKPPPPRSRFSSVRAKDFGDVVFTVRSSTWQRCISDFWLSSLDGATSLL